jgi:hypothetical protein
MRYDVKNRIMSLSFKRQPEEHADVMFAAGRRMMRVPNASYGWRVIVGAIGFGAAVGVSMEVYRRFILSAVLGVDNVTPVSIIVLQLLPLLLLLLALIYYRTRFVSRRRRQALIARMDADQFIDTDIFREGVRSTSGPVIITMDWTAIRAILIENVRIEFEGEAFTMYIPQRAFENRKAFDAAANEFRTLWQDARNKQMLPGSIAKI